MKYLHKGDKVCVHGDLLLREYVDKQGVNRSALQVTASEVEFMTARTNMSDNQKTNQEASNPTPPDDEDDLPF